jgi:hypothetical protein
MHVKNRQLIKNKRFISTSFIINYNLAINGIISVGIANIEKVVNKNISINKKFFIIVIIYFV